MSDTPGYVKNLKKESVVQSVINCLTDAMRNKQLKPGDRIPPEPELAASMGVARSSVRVLEQLLDQMRGIVRGDGQDKVERFFAVDNQFHDMVSQMGKNPLADKISRVVRTLTHAVRYETVSTMINTGRGEELLEAHSDLFETLRSRRQDNVEEIVRATYFKAALYGQEKN